MRTPCCHTFVAFILKFLIFFQTFIGISIILYSAYMLNQWEKHLPIPPSPPSPSPPPSDLAPAQSPDSIDSVFSIFNTGRVSDQVIHLNVEADTITGIHGGIKLDSNGITAPWFIYAFMGLGIVLCCISCIGHIAAEAINGCCLCFYTILKIVLILLEVALVAFIALDHRWEKDIPEDPTGEIDSIREFIEDNVDLCKWVGIAIIIIQELGTNRLIGIGFESQGLYRLSPLQSPSTHLCESSIREAHCQLGHPSLPSSQTVICLLLALVLGMTVSSQKKDGDDDLEECSSRRWEPLLNPHSSQASGSTSGDVKSFHSDLWSSRMREKYGLNGSQSNQSA